MENSSLQNSSCQYEYTDTGTWHFVLVTTVLGMINAVVISGNVLIVSAVFTCHKLRSVTNLFIASLACADLFLGVTVLPFSVAQEVLSYWIFGSFWCSIWLAVDVWMCTASILNLCVISLDRYLAITRPFKYHDLMSQARGKIFIGLVWIISFVICLPPLVGWNEQRSSIVKIEPPTIRHNLSEFNLELYQLGLQPENVSYAFVSGTDVPFARTMSCNDGPKRCELVSEPGYIVYSASGSFYIPCCILVFFYWRIYLAATRATKALKRGTITTKSHTRKGEYLPNSEVSVTLRVHRGGSKQFAESPSLVSRGSVRSYTGSIRSQHNGSSSWVAGQNGSVKSTKRHAAITTSRPKRSRSRASYTPINASINEHESDLPEKPLEAVTPSPKARHSMPCPSLPRNFSITSDTNDFESNTITKMESERSYTTIPQKAKRQGKSRSQPVNSYSIDCENISVTSRRSTKASYSQIYARENHKTHVKNQFKRFHREKKAAKTLAVIVGVFIVCWLPFFTVYLIGAFCKDCTPPLVFSIFFWLGYCNSALNPCIYALFSKDYRYAFKNLICCNLQKVNLILRGPRGLIFRKPTFSTSQSASKESDSTSSS